ncbi:hypothetical protein WN51_05698 [Melipona quadrifasciata]|uniref:Uncharacterized protein n=1 Tax=Melipona quadrifasciata TaxID=166423 RepID=A0A0N0BKS4_9HYME|nr:hypothetical protein WN51_05698 [Melipona quadrifasciata]
MHKIQVQGQVWNSSSVPNSADNRRFSDTVQATWYLGVDCEWGFDKGAGSLRRLVKPSGKGLEHPAGAVPQEMDRVERRWNDDAVLRQPDIKSNISDVTAFEIIVKKMKKQIKEDAWCNKFQVVDYKRGCVPLSTIRQPLLKRAIENSTRPLNVTTITDIDDGASEFLYKYENKFRANESCKTSNGCVDYSNNVELSVISHGIPLSNKEKANYSNTTPIDAQMPISIGWLIVGFRTGPVNPRLTIPSPEVIIIERKSLFHAQTSTKRSVPFVTAIPAISQLPAFPPITKPHVHATINRGVCVAFVFSLLAEPSPVVQISRQRLHLGTPVPHLWEKPLLSAKGLPKESSEQKCQQSFFIKEKVVTTKEASEGQPKIEEAKGKRKARRATFTEVEGFLVERGEARERPNTLGEDPIEEYRPLPVRTPYNAKKTRFLYENMHIFELTRITVFHSIDSCAIKGAV